MDIIRQQQDENGLWHFKIGGVASDSLYRLADLSRETTSPADWLAANAAEAQVAIDAGVYNEETARGLATGAAHGGALAWFEANPAAMALFDLSVADLETEINSLVDVLLPLATVPNRTKQKRLLTGLAIAVRVLVKREGLG